MGRPLGEFTPLLLESSSASEFLARAETELRRANPEFSYEAFARRAGFASRSYVRQIFKGLKPITLKTFPAFAKALGLDSESRDTLRALLAEENGDFDPSLASRPLASVVENRKERLRRKVSRNAPSEPLDSLRGIRSWPQIYAAVGEGSTREDLARKSKSGGILVDRALEALVSSGLVRRDGSVYRQSNGHVVLSNAVHATLVHAHFESVLRSALKRAKAGFADENALYFVSSYRMKKGRVPEFKKKLTDLLLSYVDESGDGSGDSEVVSLAATLI